jgi:hypothetical protein
LTEQNQSLHDRSIGEIISRTKELSADIVAEILAYQKETGLRFGEAAVALGHVRLRSSFTIPIRPSTSKN